MISLPFHVFIIIFLRKVIAWFITCMCIWWVNLRFKRINILIYVFKTLQKPNYSIYYKNLFMEHNLICMHVHCFSFFFDNFCPTPGELNDGVSNDAHTPEDLEEIATRKSSFSQVLKQSKSSFRNPNSLVKHGRKAGDSSLSGLMKDMEKMLSSIPPMHSPLPPSPFVVQTFYYSISIHIFK